MFGLDDVNWSKWEAIGTFFTGCVALFIALLPQILRWRDRPKIDLNEGGDYFPDYRLGFTITNNGRTTAKNVNVKLEKVIQDGTNKLRKYERFSICDTIEMLQYKDWKPIFFIQVVRDSLFMQEFNIVRKDTIIELLITGDNFKTFPESFKFIDNSEYDKVKLIKI